jgi:hypothetical protein
MSKLDDLMTVVNSTESSQFDWDRDADKLIDFIADLCFKADVDGENMYLLVPMTVINKNRNLKWLTKSQADEMACTGTVSGLGTYSLCEAASILYNFQNGLVKIFITRTSKWDKSAQENFAICFTQNKDFLRRKMAFVKPKDGDFEYGKYQFNAKDTDWQYANTFNSLRKVVKFATQHVVDLENFYQKINILMLKQFQDPLSAVRDDKYSETNIRKTATSPFSKTKWLLTTQFTSMINGISYAKKYWKAKQTFSDGDTTSEQQGLAALEAVRKAAIKVDPTFTEFEKVAMSNMWEQGQENSAELKVTKTDDKIYAELMVARNGLVYYILRKGENPDVDD